EGQPCGEQRGDEGVAAHCAYSLLGPCRTTARLPLPDWLTEARLPAPAWARSAALQAPVWLTSASAEAPDCSTASLPPRPCCTASAACPRPCCSRRTVPSGSSCTTRCEWPDPLRITVVPCLSWVMECSPGQASLPACAAAGKASPAARRASGAER